ncbi:hypothetical protein E4T56_gene16995 [Termitomyces sp. T112]|nr:hypothetical protein E4T56_gene16995 [Termitomyces sp. T112]
MQLKSLFVLASFAVLSFAQTTPVQVENAGNDITHNITLVITALEAFPASGATLEQVMDLHSADIDVNNALVAFGDDITNAACPFSDSDASAILTILQDQAPAIQTALEDFVALKPEFDTLGATSLILQDLTTIKGSGDAAGAALAACSSSNIAPAVGQFIAAVDAAFAPVLSDFA